MQSEVIAMHELRASDRFYTLVYPAAGAEATNVINRAANRMIRMAIGANRENVNLFPSLRNSWTIGPTVVGKNYVQRPTDCLAAQRVVSAQQATTPTVDGWAQLREFEVAFVAREKFALLIKPGQATWPNIWTMKGRTIEYYPTTQTGFPDNFRLYGIARALPLVNATDAFFFEEDLHPLVVTIAAALLAEKRSWFDQSRLWLATAQNELSTTANQSGLETQRDDVAVDGLAERGDLYMAAGV